MPVERGGPPLRRVASEDPSLSASANARLTSELQDVVRAKRARLDLDQADPARAAHATHSTTVATLIDVRLGGVLTAAVIAVALGVVLITRSTSVLVLVPVFLLLLGLAAGIVRMVNRMTASPEHPSADLAAQLEQGGVGDPDRLMTDLVDEFTPSGAATGAERGTVPDDAAHRLERVEREIVGCVRCPRLVAWRRAVALAPPARFRDEMYWSRPVPGFGDPRARLHVLGLGTAAHGGNRTGRAMTGNATADWVVGALHEVGLASRATSERRGDGLRLDGVWVSSAVRCPPPGDRPTGAERAACSGHLVDELAALTELRVVLALGGQAWAAATRALDARPRPRFAHGAECTLPNGRIVVGSYHPSRRTTQTGLLSWAMFVSVVRRATVLAGAGGSRTEPPAV